MTIGLSFVAYKSCENDEIADMWSLILQELAFLNATNSCSEIVRRRFRPISVQRKNLQTETTFVQLVNTIQYCLHFN